jgi:two-component system, response regulator RegA
MNKQVLILEDDVRLAKSLEQEFMDHGYTVTLAMRLGELPATMQLTHAVIDLRLSGGDFGLDAVSALKVSFPEIRMIVLSGYGSITTAVEAIKRGAVDYLTKPASFREIEKALNGSRVAEQLDFKRRSLAEVEHEYIDFMLTKNDGNISRTARDLGLHRQSLQRKLKKYT